LAMVDASVGGKTGINFGDYKNEIGAFQEANYVVISTEFLRSLDEENFRSGYAEMLKHALLKDKQMLVQHLQFDIAKPDYAALLPMVKESIEFKSSIVEQDPTERGLRKALNLGHTVGHAIESLMLRRNTPVLHGYAVAWGLVCELFIAATRLGFPTAPPHPAAGGGRRACAGRSGMPPSCPARGRHHDDSFHRIRRPGAGH